MVSLVMSMSTDLKSVLHSRLTEFLTAGIPVDENLDGDSVINTSSPMLGVRDAEFRRLGKPQPEVSDRVFIKTVGGHVINQLFVVSNINPDSHGGSRLVLNVVKSR